MNRDRFQATTPRDPFQVEAGFANGWPVFQVMNLPTDNASIEEARRLFQAAPELLLACEALIKATAAKPRELVPEMAAAVELAHAAIKKAERGG